MNNFPEVSLSNIGTLERGKGLLKSDFDDSGTIPCIHYGQIFTYYGGFTESTISFVTSETARNCTVVNPGDVILAITSENVEDLCKSTAWLGGSDIVTGGHSGVFRHNQNPKFLGYYFQSEYFNCQKAKYAKGTKVIEINPEDILKRIKIKLPDSETQQKIVGILETTASLCKLYMKRSEIETQKLKALKYELFYNTDKAGDVVKLKDLFVFKTGYTPSKSNAKYWDDGTIPWFRMEDIRKNGRILNDSIQHVTRAAIKGKIFPANSIIMSTTATIGEYALLTSDSLANQQFTFLTRKVNCCECINITYFYHYCSILSEWCKRNVNSGGLLAVDMKAFENYKMKLPAIDEQAKIAKILSMQEQKIDLLNKMTKCARKQHKYLLNHLINGDLDLSKIQLEEKDKSC